MEMYRLSQEQRAVVEQVRRIADDEIAPLAADVDKRERFPTESIAALSREGLLGLTVPQEYGGMDQGLRVACAVLDEIGQRCASTGMIFMMHLSGVACYTARPDRAERQLREIAEGRHLTTLAWSEPGSGSDFWAPVSREVRENGEIRLNADKSFVTSAGNADGYVVSTGWSEGKVPTESMLYLVLKGLSAILCKRPDRYNGTRPGKTMDRWYRAAGQSLMGRVQRSLAFWIAR